MSRRPSTLRPGGDVLWYVPNRKRAVAATTRASSDLANLLVEDGADTFRELGECVNFDPDLLELVAIMERHGVADRPIRYEDDGIVFEDDDA